MFGKPKGRGNGILYKNILPHKKDMIDFLGITQVK
jgi:hypothetical protein